MIPFIYRTESPLLFLGELDSLINQRVIFTEIKNNKASWWKNPDYKLHKKL